jgi:hypothetical protein
MTSYELLSKIPIVPIVTVLIAVVACGAFIAYMKTRNHKGVAGQIALYSFLAVLFAIDFFLFLRRDSFHASWSLTFWLVLAAFMVGERVGRWTSTFSAGETAERKDAG